MGKERLRGRVARGFTLVELMITVTLIVILTTLTMPNLLSGRNAHRIKTATNHTIDIFLIAKTRAANDFNAYGLRLDAGETGSGRIQVYEGSGPACGTITWAEPIRTLDYAEEFGPADGDVRIIQLTPSGITDLCFTPDGRLVNAVTKLPVPSADPNYGAGEFIISLQSHLNDKPVGLVHHVILSYAGKARFTFGADPMTPEGEGGG